MKNEFIARLEVSIEFTSEEVALLAMNAKRHYSSDCKELDDPDHGGIINGMRNYINWGREEGQTTTGPGRFYTDRQTQLLMKTLEVDDSREASALYRKINEARGKMVAVHVAINSVLSTFGKLK